MSRFVVSCLSLGVLLVPSMVPAQSVQGDSSVVSPDGTARITRVVPLPEGLSAEAKARWSKPVSDAAKPQTLAERRAGTDAWQTRAGKRSAEVYPVKITEGQTIAGVPVRLIDPLAGAALGPVSGSGSGGDVLHYSTVPSAAPVGGTVSTSGLAKHPDAAGDRSDRVLICLHGGGFNSDSGSYTEAIPIANLTRTRVVSVLYRLAPEHPYPAALDDAIAVYRELLTHYKPDHVAIFGTSAGAILTGEVAARIKQLGLPQPAALGIFSGFGDYSALGDSSSLFALEGLSGHMDPPAANPDHHSVDPAYTTTHDPRDPVLSPNYADLRGLAPTLFVTSSRDVLLSGTSTMERAWARDGVATRLVVFDGLPHAFWNDVDLPESREAYATMARFFLDNLK